MMVRVKVKRGDVFGCSNPMSLGRCINAIQKFWADDSSSKYSHSGIILDAQGTTLEALWTVTSKNLFMEHEGDKVIIARPIGPFNGYILDIDQGLLLIKKHEGQWYPVWTLLMHMFPPFAKVALFDRFVCSELVAKYEWLAGARHGQYKGTNPDTLADEWRNWKNFDVIFEGEL